MFKTKIKIAQETGLLGLTKAVEIDVVLDGRLIKLPKSLQDRCEEFHGVTFTIDDSREGIMVCRSNKLLAFYFDELFPSAGKSTSLKKSFVECIRSGCDDVSFALKLIDI